MTAAERADKAALKYAGKQHRYRAETTVTTELAFAYNRGAHMGVSQAIGDRLMGRCEMVWTTAGTNRVCGRCLALKDKVVGHTDESGVTLPPLHPRCRCAIMYNEVGDKPQGSPKWRRQEHFSTSDENVKATNPNFGLGVAFQINCQKCVPTYEMRMRGYDVTARPTYNINADSFTENDWDKAFEEAELEEGFSGSGKEEITKKLEVWGDGSRAEVYVAWEEGAAHVFVAENRNGKIYFLDPQTGELDVEYYFSHVKSGLTKLIRIDNLNLTKNILSGVARRPNEIMTLKEAIKIAENHIPKGHTLCRSFGEVQGKYVFSSQDSRGIIPPGDFRWTVDKASGICKCEHLEHEGNKPWLPIRGYKKLELND